MVIGIELNKIGLAKINPYLAVGWDSSSYSVRKSSGIDIDIKKNGSEPSNRKNFKLETK